MSCDIEDTCVCRSDSACFDPMCSTCPHCGNLSGLDDEDDDLSDEQLAEDWREGRLKVLRCGACGTSEAFTTGDPDWCPRCHAQGKRTVARSAQ